MQRRTFLQGLAAAGALSGLPFSFAHAMTQTGSVSVESLPKLEGDLTLYLGRGEGGLYENVLKAIEKRNPKFNLKIRRGGSAALANTIVAETKAGVKRADLFWAVDTGSIGMVTDAGAAKPLPDDLTAQLREDFQYPSWSPVTGRVRTLPYNTERVKPEQIPESVMALADSDLKIGWAPAYSSFQSFVTAMRILEGDKATKSWLKGINKHSKKYAGELGVVMGVERGEVSCQAHQRHVHLTQYGRERPLHGAEVSERKTSDEGVHPREIVERLDSIFWLRVEFFDVALSP